MFQFQMNTLKTDCGIIPILQQHDQFTPLIKVFSDNNTWRATVVYRQNWFMFHYKLWSVHNNKDLISRGHSFDRSNFHEDLKQKNTFYQPTGKCMYSITASYSRHIPLKLYTHIVSKVFRYMSLQHSLIIKQLSNVTTGL